MSLYVPVAVNCCVRPFAIVGVAGVTAIDCSVAAVTVSTSTGEVTPLRLAVMLLVPTATPVANPAAVMVAAAVFDEFQVTCAVTFGRQLSLYVPVAVNCCVRPFAIVGFAGVTAIDCSVAAVTVSTSTGEVTPLRLAVMLLVPTATPVANPAAVMVAAAVFDEFQVTCAVTFAVEVSLYVPVAVNCCVNPFASVGLAGVTAIDCSVAAVTVSTSTGEVTPLRLAVMLLVPTATPVANPAAVMVAAVVFDDSRSPAPSRSPSRYRCTSPSP